MTAKITVTSSSIVQCEAYEFCLDYEDGQGTVSFRGFEEGHACGGMLYFPTLEQWDTWLPNRRGQRKRILVEILNFVRQNKKYHGYLERSLTDLGFLARWPRESNYLGTRYRTSPVPQAAAGKFIRDVTVITSKANPQSKSAPVSRVDFDRPFRTQVFNLNQRESVRLCSARTASHPSRVEIQFLMPFSKEIPESFDDLAVEDITDVESPSITIPATLNRMKGMARLFSLVAGNGTQGFVLCIGAMFWEDDAPPGAPSKVDVWGTSPRNQY